MIFKRSAFILTLCCLLLVAAMLSPLAVLAQEPEVVTLEASPLEHGGEVTVIAPTVVSELPPTLPAPAPDDVDFWDRFTALPDWAINGFLVVIGLMGIGFVVLAVHAISSSNRSYPPGTGAAIERLVTSIDERSQQTANTMDDFLMHILKPLLESGIGAIKEREGRLVITPELAAEIKSRATSEQPYSRNVGVPLEQHLPLDAPPGTFG